MPRSPSHSQRLPTHPPAKPSSILLIHHPRPIEHRDSVLHSVDGVANDGEDDEENDDDDGDDDVSLNHFECLCVCVCVCVWAWAWVWDMGIGVGSGG